MILDNVDLKILDELQRDGSLSNVTLAKRIGLSPSPCLARVKALESNGVIQRYVALASAAAIRAATGSPGGPPSAASAEASSPYCSTGRWPAPTRRRSVRISQ